MIIARSEQAFLPFRYFMAFMGVGASLLFTTFWLSGKFEFWVSCYVTAIILSCVFLWTHRRNIISLSGVFVGLSLVAITMPAVPYLVFGLEPVNGFHASIFLNSLGHLYFLSLAFIFVPSRSLRCLGSQLYRGPHWDQFVSINGIICLITLPIVLVAITAAGAWGYLLGDRSGDFDRVASLKGLGPLMIFSVINITAMFFWACGKWLRGYRWQVLFVVLLLLFLNGFTGGRQKIITCFFGGLLIYAAVKGIRKKTLFFAIAFGFAIVFMKIFRNWGVGDPSQIPWYVSFFLHFSGDFDSLNNVSVLINYTGQNGFFGFYHIWSNILVYVPREIFPDKSHFLGSLYLNSYLFPGVYRGAEGGTGFAFGFQGIWYAVYGLPTLVLGNILLALSFGWADHSIYRKLHQSFPTIFVVAYFFLIGQSIITYREGFYSFLNCLFYVGIYFVLFKFIQLMLLPNQKVKLHATVGAPRHLEQV